MKGSDDRNYCNVVGDRRTFSGRGRRPLFFCTSGERNFHKGGLSSESKNSKIPGKARASREGKPGTDGNLHYRLTGKARVARGEAGWSTSVEHPCVIVGKTSLKATKGQNEGKREKIRKRRVLKP